MAGAVTWGALLGVFACGDEATVLNGAPEAASNDTSDGPRGEDPSDGTPATDTPSDGAANPSPLYVVSTGIISGDDFLGYLATVPSLDAGTTFDLDRAVEVGAGAWIFSRPGDDSVFVASLLDATIVRWQVLGDARFERRETLDFGGVGLSTAYLAASAPIFSAEKSYFVDEDQDQVVIWNPARMELIGTIALGDENQGTLRPIPEGALLVQGDELLVTVGWRDPDDTSVYGDHVRLVRIDTTTDQIAGATTETRNSHEAFSAKASDGTSYFSPYSLYAAYTQIGAGHGAPSVALRIQPPATSFDASYELDLSALVGGRPAGDFTLLDDQTALIRAWHPELVDPVDPASWQDVLWNQAGFWWWRWHIGDAAATRIENQEPGALGASVFAMDDKIYSTRYAADLSSTTLVEITPDGEFLPAMQGPGQFVGNGVLRIR
ncbi:MAG TPA: hypothetical protein VMG12_02275 [Polyangiaceae bacterium]|nr:hypothetical protein [Polyangiaceae bacterium]